MRGLASPHPFLGATSGSLVRCLRVACDVQFEFFWSGYASVLCALLGSTAGTVHVSVFSGFWTPSGECFAFSAMLGSSEDTVVAAVSGCMYGVSLLRHTFST